MMDCLDSLKINLGEAKNLTDVNWSQVNIQDINNNNFQFGKPFYLVCPGEHCQDNVNFTPQAHRLCQCTDINGHSIPGCSPHDYLYPYAAQICFNTSNPSDLSHATLGNRGCMSLGDTWNVVTCYCCCSCFAHGTQIGTPQGSQAIEKFSVGDKVITASLKQSSEGLQLEWKKAKLNFSNGTGPESHQPAMIYIRFGGHGSIIVTPDHLFLMPSGKLKRADRLVPGKDLLVSYNNTHVEINEISVGEYRGGVHHIATDVAFDGTLDGHLLLSEGLVSGDFNLQIHQRELQGSGLLEDTEDLPIVGTKEYEAAHSHLVAGNYLSFSAPNLKAGEDTHAVAATAQAAAQRSKFYVHGSNVAFIPDNAASFISPLQAIDVNDKADRWGFTEVSIGNAMVKYLVNLFQGFYPDITFYHDIGRLEPNAYAFTQYGKQYIVLSGGLTRIKGLGMEGMAFILGNMVSRLQKSAPLNADGFTTVGMADYYTPAILQNMFFGNLYAPLMTSGLEQIQNVIFGNINASLHDAFETDPFQPTTGTRMDAVEAGNGMNFPPNGIGGPELNGLKVTGATVTGPAISAASLVTADITADLAAAAFKLLQDKNIVDAAGLIAADFTVATDLSFLFADQTDEIKTLLTEEVRYVLLHAASTVELHFNTTVKAIHAADEDDFSFTPNAVITDAQPGKSNSSVLLKVSLERGVTYTVSVSRALTSDIGSTLDPNSSTAEVTLK
ncbi:Hint domain-containing protein [Paenibacillus sp. BK033]|uniref:Hint domain-containing protein n=1 Tax=Paenibacillus sp. BK033 TaxID=2512133 RepID=UPI001FB5D966|nr:Hint domain-containing protein [Paenibacillus sp. BK033]